MADDPDAAIAGEGIAYLPVGASRMRSLTAGSKRSCLGRAGGRASAWRYGYVDAVHPKARLGKVRALVDFLEAELVEA